MKTLTTSTGFTSILPAALVGSVFVGFVAIVSLVLFPGTTLTPVEMRVEPLERTVAKSETFDIQIVVESKIPVNVFAGELHFSKDLLKVTSIDYNTSIADLWAELPWYSNGEGTMNFGGGTTNPGGFLGSGTLITVEFESLATGEGVISLHDPRVLIHDGLGTDAEVTTPIDAIFTIETESANLLAETPKEVEYVITDFPPSTDLNGDGEQTFVDISIFMLNIFSDDARYDFNLDGEVDGEDLNILIDAG